MRMTKICAFGCMQCARGQETYSVNMSRHKALNDWNPGRMNAYEIVVTNREIAGTKVRQCLINLIPNRAATFTLFDNDSTARCDIEARPSRVSLHLFLFFGVVHVAIQNYSFYNMPHESASVLFARVYYIEVSILENEIQYHT